MKLISCNCGVVLDAEKLDFGRSVWHEDQWGGQTVNEDHARWNGHTYVAVTDCPVCGDKIDEEGNWYA